MLTVLPTSEPGVSYGINVLKNLITTYPDNVVAIVQIGGEIDNINPESSAIFIVVMMNQFNFTAFVNEWGTSPETELYSGTGSQYYDEMRQFVNQFLGEEDNFITYDNEREVSPLGLRPRSFGLTWSQLETVVEDYLEIHPELKVQESQLTTRMNPTHKYSYYFMDGMEINERMEVYKRLLIKYVFVRMYEILFRPDYK